MKLHRAGSLGHLLPGDENVVECALLCQGEFCNALDLYRVSLSMDEAVAGHSLDGRRKFEFSRKRILHLSL